MKAELQYELIKAQQQHQLEKAALLRQIKGEPQPNPVVAALGRQMVKLGTRLSGEIADTTEAALPVQYSYEAR
jgi:predicted protein tyrosine phosphatase